MKKTMLMTSLLLPLIMMHAAWAISAPEIQSLTHVAEQKALLKPIAKVNINKASLTKLKSLSGIGKQKAKAIMAYRDSHPEGFKDITDLLQVPGISAKLFEKIKPKVTV